MAFNWFWKQVFAAKKRSGWVDFGHDITVTGAITMVDENISGAFNDGDVCFNVKLDPGDEWAITVAPWMDTHNAGRVTSEDGKGPSIHCEITPWDRDKFTDKIPLLAVGKRVKVSGAWGFDGVHTGSAEWIEIIKAILTHPPNWKDGWFEIHPVKSLEFLP